MLRFRCFFDKTWICGIVANAVGPTMMTSYKGVIYVAGAGHVVAVNEEGREVWRNEFSESGRPVTVLHAGKESQPYLYIGHRGRVCMYNTETEMMMKEWRSGTKDFVSLAMKNNILIVATAKKIWALHPRSLETQWKQKLDHTMEGQTVAVEIVSSPAHTSRSHHHGHQGSSRQGSKSGSGLLLGHSGGNGGSNNAFLTRQSSHSSAASTTSGLGGSFGEEIVMVSVWHSKDRSSLYSFRLNDGTPRWTCLSLKSGYCNGSASLLSHAGFILVASSGGYLHGLHMVDKHLRFRLSFGRSWLSLASSTSFSNPHSSQPFIQEQINTLLSSS